jgi:hypothetical protein
MIRGVGIGEQDCAALIKRENGNRGPTLQIAGGVNRVIGSRGDIELKPELAVAQSCEAVDGWPQSENMFGRKAYSGSSESG